MATDCTARCAGRVHHIAAHAAGACGSARRRKQPSTQASTAQRHSNWYPITTKLYTVGDTVGDTVGGSDAKLISATPSKGRRCLRYPTSSLRQLTSAHGLPACPVLIHNLWCASSRPLPQRTPIRTRVRALSRHSTAWCELTIASSSAVSAVEIDLEANWPLNNPPQPQWATASRSATTECRIMLSRASPSSPSSPSSPFTFTAPS